jgi:membrane-bound lytic murein transglycosylase D
MTSFARLFLMMNALFLLAWVLMMVLRVACARMKTPPSWRQQLHLAYALVAAAVLAPVFAMPSSSGDFLPTAAQVWSAPSMQLGPGQAAESLGVAMLSITATETHVSVGLLSQAASVLFLAGILFALGRTLIGTRALRRIVRQSSQIARSGKLRVLATDQCAVPFSFWMPGARLIVVPSSLIVRPADLRVAIRHEGQHHRGGDTWLIYASELLRGAFFINPAVHALCRTIHELQEFACDEAVAERRNVTARSYCDCLLWVAQNSLTSRPPGACMRMAGNSDRGVLARRIQAVMQRPAEYLRKPGVLAINMAAIAILVGTGVVLPGAVQDRRVSSEQAHAMAQAASKGSSFPIVMNDQVLEELNRLMGTPDGRAFMRDSLKRMRTHEPLVSGLIAQYDLPTELLAVPITESGYRNLPQAPNGIGAGLWQFIKPTARAYGLVVDETRDERLDPRLETDAAMRMLTQLHGEFGDWNLALLAYNGGSRLVQRGIQESGSRDAFRLVELGYQNDKRYLPRVMATVIVLRNEHLL